MEHVQLRDESKDASLKAIDVIKVKAAYTRMVVLQPRERHVVFRQFWSMREKGLGRTLEAWSHLHQEKASGQELGV